MSAVQATEVASDGSSIGGPDGRIEQAGSLVLALSARCLDGSAGFAGLELWPGPCVVVVLPDHKIDRQLIQALDESVVVVEFLEAPSCAAHLFAALMKIDGLTGSRATSSFLYFDAEPSRDRLAALAGQVSSNPMEITLERGDGGTRLLLLGRGVLAHPLLPTFMNVISEWHVDDELFCTLLQEKLLGLSR